MRFEEHGEEEDEEEVNGPSEESVLHDDWAKEQGIHIERCQIDFQKQYLGLREFEGNIADREIVLQDKVYLMMPSSLFLLPSNVLVFELVQLSSATSSIDHVMGWGAFPLINYGLEINEGRFKVPLVKGGYQPSVDKFKDIEDRVKRNVDEWLCNIYIEVCFRHAFCLDTPHQVTRV